MNVPPYEELTHRSNPIRILDLKPEVDLLTGITGVTFDKGWAEAIETTFDGDLRVRVLSEAHVIVSQPDSRPAARLMTATQWGFRRTNKEPS